MKEDEIQPPKSLRDRIKLLKETKTVFTWAWKNILTEESKKWLKRVFISVLLSIGFASLDPFIISYIFKGLMNKDDTMIIWSLVSLCLCLQLKKYFEIRKDKAREWVIGLHWGKLNHEIATLFYGLSVAQHIEYAERLSVSHVDKGRGKILLLQQVLLFDGVPTVVTMIISLVCLFFISFVGGLIMLSILLIYMIWSLFLNAKVMSVCKPLEKMFRKLGNRVTERMEAVVKVKSNAKEKQEIIRDGKEFDEVMEKDRSFWLWFLNVVTGRSMLNAFGYSLVIAWGVWQVRQGYYALGVLYPLFMWTRAVSENIWRLADVEHQINWHLPSVNSMLKSLMMKPTITIVENPVVITKESKFEIFFDDVSHTYPRESKKLGCDEEVNHLPVLNRISLEIEQGKKVALLGPSGGGKSTFTSLLLRHMDPTSGRILVDGVDLKQLDLDSYLRQIGYIAQQSIVFDGTIKENLLYGLSPEEQLNVTDDELWEMMKLLQIDFGKRLDKGLNTHVGRSGLKLSGGQAQRLMIGAAAIKKPRLFIADEATSSLDAENEALVQEGLERVLSGNVSALFIAHRYSTVRSICNKFIFINPSDKVEDGKSQIEAEASSFDELFDISPTFRKLAVKQGLVSGSRSISFAA